MKKTIIVLLILISIYFLLPIKETMSNEGQLVLKFVEKTAVYLKNKYQLQPAGHGVSMPGGPLREIHLIFDTNSAMPKDKLRQMLIALASELVQSVNSTPTILKVLYEQPFTYKNVSITIFNHDKNGRQIYDPKIAVARNLNGRISYSTVDSPNYSDYKHTSEETYEEALEKIKNSN